MDEKNLLIDKDLALAMTMAYDKRKKESGRVIPNVDEDTSYVYIPMEKLRNYIKKYDKAQGVRVYFGVINNYTINGINFPCLKEHKNHTTVILKATDKNSLIGIDPLIAIPPIKIIDYDPEDEFGICPPPSEAGGKCDSIDQA